jgi:YD repeat-containing protein
VKTLLTGIVALTIAGCALAQAGEVYDGNGRLAQRSVHNGNILTSYSPDGRPLPFYTVRSGSNSVRTYDTNGRLQRIGIRRGNNSYIYDGKGRLVARGYFNSDGSSKLYDARGRYIASTTR